MAFRIFNNNNGGIVAALERVAELAKEGVETIVKTFTDSDGDTSYFVPNNPTELDDK